MSSPPTSPAAGGTGLVRLVVSVETLDAALSFYRDLLGLDVRHRGVDLAALTTADGIEVLLHQRAAAPSDVAVAAGFLVRDVDATVQRWRRGGGAVLDPPADQPWGERMAVVRDPDGHLVCLSSAVTPVDTPTEGL